MGITFQKLKKWTNMVLGKSVYHVRQDEGKAYSASEIKGYYNNLTEKVSRFGLEGNTIPSTILDSGEEVYFSIAIFQYGLGAYDLYLLNNDPSMLEKAKACGKWALENLPEDGGWVTFPFENQEQPYSSMAQGEGVSLLCRLYTATKDEIYLPAIKKAVEFMLTPLDAGGTAKYDGEDVYLYEYTFEPLILNGWIFSIWGLWDYCKLFDDARVSAILDATLATLRKTVGQYDTGSWSMYNIKNRICSPFYHRLHIAQLNVLYDMTGDEIYKQYADKWAKYEKNPIKKGIAFTKKAIQKILEKD